MSPKTTPSAPSVSAALPAAWAPPPVAATPSRTPSPSAGSVEEGDDILNRGALRHALLLARGAEVQQADAALGVGDVQRGATGRLAQDRRGAPVGGQAAAMGAEQDR